MHAVGIYGSGIDDRLIEAQIQELHPWLTERLQYLNGWARHRGGDDNSHGYIGQHEYVGTMGAIQAWRTATGEDLLEDFHWARLMPPYYIYHSSARAAGHTARRHQLLGQQPLPGRNRRQQLRQPRPRLLPGRPGMVVDSKPHHRPAARLRDLRQTVGAAVVERSQRAADRSREPAAHDAVSERGYVSMRSDWSDEAVLGHFHCGRFESDGRNNADNNSFIIYRGGYLACDTGTRAINNPEQTEMSDGRHHNRYFIQTIAHNSITVGTDDVAGERLDGSVRRPSFPPTARMDRALAPGYWRQGRPTVASRQDHRLSDPSLVRLCGGRRQLFVQPGLRPPASRANSSISGPICSSSSTV